MLGISFVLFGTVIAWTGRISRLTGYLAVLVGLAYLAQGWVVGAEGFSANGTIPGLLALLLEVIWVIWLAVIAWRMKESAEPRVQGDST